jgi:DNA invertase Pin-like site-specific DNA recombinase
MLVYEFPCVISQALNAWVRAHLMLWHFLGIFAEFEHGIRRERQAIGIAKARERGVTFGRPRISWAKRREILTLREQGLGINKIARRLRVGTGSVVRTIQGADHRSPQVPRVRHDAARRACVDNDEVVHDVKAARHA